MADSTIAITAGTGTAVDTRTEATNGHHRQVIVIGDPATNAGVAPVDATTGLKVDLGEDNDITGTVTANAGTNLNTSALALEAGGNLAAIKAKTDNIPAQGQALAAASVPVVLTAAQITTLTPPAAITGFATSAKQDTLIGHVDGVETLLGTIDADTSTLAATDFATEAKQDAIITAIGAIPGGGGTQYTEGDTDATITGTAALVEGGANALAVLTQPLTDTQLRATPVPISGSITADLGANNDVTVTSGSITATQATGTNLHVVVDSAPTTAVTGTFYQATQPISGTVTANLSATDNAVLDTIAAKDFATQTTLAAINTKLVTGTDIGDVTINNSSGAAAVNIQDGGNTITVDGTVAVTNAGITTIAGAVAGTEMQVDVLTMPTVTVNSHAVTNAGTFATQATLAAETTKVIGTVNIAASQTVGLVAGTAAIGKLTANSGVDIGDVTLTAGTAAIGSVLPADIDVTTHTNYAKKYYTNAGAVTDGIIWSPAAGKRWHVLSLTINVSAAATVTLEDDKAGGDEAVMKFELAANSGVTIPFPERYPFASGEDAADLLITTTAGNVFVTCVGYEI